MSSRPTQALTVFAEILPGRRDALEALLATIHDDLTGNPTLRPGELPDTHFTRLLIIDDFAHELPPILCWESNHDGARDDYAIACWRACGAGLDAVFAHCVDYPKPDERDPETFAGWVGRHAVRSEAFYSGYRAVPHAQVVNDHAVHQEIRAFLDRERATLRTLPPAEVQARVRAHLATTGLDTSAQGEGDFWWRLGTPLVHAAYNVVAVLFFWLFIPAWFYLLHREKLDVPDPLDAPVYADPRHTAEEDHIVQNQLSLITEVKPGWFRFWVLRLVLLVIDLLAATEFTHGDLGGITSIHFARWVLIPDRREGPGPRRHRLAFFSNYDGSWDAYLGEFIDRAADGLTAVWSQTVGFPRTEKLKGRGARDEEAFKQWVRRRQIFTHVWWSGVPDSTVENVRTDVWIRRRIEQALTEEERTQWLRRL